MKREDIHYPLGPDAARELLRAHDINPTSQRVTIACFLLSRQQHLSAEQILAGVNDRDSTVSKATVYNTLGAFSAKGLVREVLTNPERVFYDSNLEAHFHIYNVDTGALEDFPVEAMKIDQLPELPPDCTLDSLDIIVRVRNHRD